MKISPKIKPTYKELPSIFADRLGEEYSILNQQESKKIKGQFFTPFEIAVKMGNLSNFEKETVRILDPGSGIGILTCALIEHLVRNQQVKKIELITYENDESIIHFLENSLNYLAIWLDEMNVDLNFKIIQKDFVLENAFVLEDKTNLFETEIIQFDIIISNPPYFKLPIDDIRSIATKAIVNGHPNIYAMFMAIASRLLKINGELIFITPRSFASGSYFKLFREKFFQVIEIEIVHVFVSRSKTFKRDKVLQETIIMKGVRKESINPNATVNISSSDNMKDINNSINKTFKHIELIDLNSNEKILHLPSSDKEENILNIFKGWDGNLKKYDICISTGPVVAFRNRNKIFENTENVSNGYVPLYWMHNVKQMNLEWPIDKKDKGQYVENSIDSNNILVPNKNYIFLRRFSTKDDKQRLIAAPYFSNGSDLKFIGVENKVNYIYRKNGHLDRSEIIGLCSLLNSKLFDSYFRIFNGNVNVSATELREMPLPPYQVIKEIGDRIILSNDYSLENINLIINDTLNFKNEFYEQS